MGVPVSHLDPLNMFWNMFWKPWMSYIPNVNDMSFKNFVNEPTVQQSQYLMEQLIQQCMSCVSDNTAILIKLFQSLPNVKTPEDFAKLQEIILAESTKKNMDHAQNLLKTYANLMQENYHCAKKQAEDLTTKFTKDTHDAMKKCGESVNKFNENNPFVQNSCSTKNSKKQHPNSE